MRNQPKGVNGTDADEEGYRGKLRQAKTQTRNRLKEAQPLTQAELALMQIKDIPDSEKQKKAVYFLISMLLREDELRDIVLEAVASDFPSRSDEEELALTPEAVKTWFDDLSQQYESSKQPGSPGRKPERADRLYAVIRGRENEAIPLEDFARVMPSTVKNPREQVSRDISKTNADFHRFHIPLSIEGVSQGYGEERKTFYRIRYRPV